MAEFKVNTGHSVFSIYTEGSDGYRAYTIQFGDKGNLVNVSMSEDGQILDVECIYTNGIRHEALQLPEAAQMKRYISPWGPSEEDEGCRWPMWLNLHPEKRELDIILYFSNPRPEYCCREGRVEFYYSEHNTYDEDADDFVTVHELECIRVRDLTEEEYAFFKQFT